MGRKTSMLPMSTEGRGGGAGLRMVGALVVIVLFALLLHDPAGAAGTAKDVAAWCRAAVEALAQFGAALSG